MYCYKIKKDGKIIGTHCGIDPIPKSEADWTEITQAEYDELTKENEHE